MSTQNHISLFFTVFLILFINQNSVAQQTTEHLDETIDVPRGEISALKIHQALNFYYIKHGYAGYRYYANYNRKINKIVIRIGPRKMTDFEKAKKELESLKDIVLKIVPLEIDNFRLVAGINSGSNVVFENGRYFLE